jgi:hypothetical protein
MRSAARDAGGARSAPSLFAFLWAWSDFIFATTLDGGGSQQPITLGIYHYIGNNDQQWNAIMATAVVASVPAAVLLVIAQRRVAAGVTAGAVKDWASSQVRGRPGGPGQRAGRKGRQLPLCQPPPASSIESKSKRFDAHGSRVSEVRPARPTRPSPSLAGGTRCSG